jgi:hypothetical protein
MQFVDTVPYELVAVIKTYFGGRVDTEYLTPFMAMQELRSPENGVTVSSLRIVPGNVRWGTLDTSGSAFAAERSLLKLDETPDSAGEINWKFD